MFRAAVTLVLFVAFTSARTYSLNNNVTLTLTGNFWPSFARALLAPTLSAQVATLEFPSSSNHPAADTCEKITINGGKWISSVTFSEQSDSTQVLAGSSTQIQLTSTGVHVANSETSESVLTWQGKKASSITNPLVEGGSYPTCFQVCYGFAPFASTTSFASNISLLLAENTVLVASTPSGAHFDTNTPWPLPTLRGRCLAPHTTFESVFNRGLGSTLGAETSNFGATVGHQLNAILANSSQLGFCGLSTASGGSTFQGCGAGSASIPEIDRVVQGSSGGSALSKAASVHVVLPISSTSPLAASAFPRTPTCFLPPTSGACGQPVTSGKISFFYSGCGACVHLVDGQPFFAFMSGLAMQRNNPNAIHSRKQDTQAVSFNQPEKRTRVSHLKTVRARSEEHGIQYRSTEPVASRGYSLATTSFFSLALFESAGALGLPAASQLFTSLSVAGTPSSGKPLPHAEQFCTIHHSVLQWASLPNNSLSINISSAEEVAHPDSNATAVRVQVFIPELSKLFASTTFKSHCAVRLPLGTPYDEQTSGWVHLRASTANSSAAAPPPFTVSFVFNSSGAVTDVSFSDLRFSATKSYNSATSAFDAYIHHELVSKVSHSLMTQTTAMIQGQLTDAWLDFIRALTTGRMSGTQGVAVAEANSSLPGSVPTLAFYQGDSASAQPPLAAVVDAPTAGTTNQDSARVETMGPAPGGFETNCTVRQTCSPHIPMDVPSAPSRSWSFQLTNCSVCLRVVDGDLYFGQRSVARFASTPKEGANGRILRTKREIKK